MTSLKKILRTSPKSTTRSTKNSVKTAPTTSKNTTATSTEQVILSYGRPKNPPNIILYIIYTKYSSGLDSYREEKVIGTVGI